MLNKNLNFFKSNKLYDEIEDIIKSNGNIYVYDICEGARTYFISSFDSFKKIIIVSDELTALQFLNELKIFDENIFYYQENDIIFNNQIAGSDSIYQNRMNIVSEFLLKERATIILTINSLFEKVQSTSTYNEKKIKILKNSDLGFNVFIKKLLEIGYTRVNTVSTFGEFSIRGSIVDIYDSMYEMPIRIDFFDDNIDTIRFFNVDTKISVDEILDIEIHPFLIKDIENCYNILEILNKKNDCKIFINNFDTIFDRMNYLYEVLEEPISVNGENNIDELKKPNKKNEFWTIDEIFGFLKNENLINISLLLSDNYLSLGLEKNLYKFEYKLVSPIYNKKDFQFIKSELKKMMLDNFSGIIFIESRLKAERILKELIDNEINSYIYSGDISLNHSEICIYIGNINSGFIDYNNKFFIFSESDIFDIKKEIRKRVKSKKDETVYEIIDTIKDLSIGDYVIHENFGIGIYRGIEKIKTNDVIKDYIKIQYADNSNLYLLVSKLDVIQKYASKNSIKPKINSLNNNDFIKIKNKIKENILEDAKELINLYAKRNERTGFSFSKDTVWQSEFEETFPYIETNDQINAIAQVKSDMESKKIMDRLICGDVGFGKTEVAIRAAFKAVQDGKQVAILAPTTILVRQHYNTFLERFKSYPVNVDFLSRFKTPKENKKTILDISNGNVDIVIGTHRLLSKDIIFKNLGLLIIDEEQRFGVSHKEKIKKMKINVDTLSLTATPIPRTLYMSLNKIRDISLLTEAPPERVPIKTYVFRYNNEIIKDAINRELKRDGQVFIIHNRISDIYTFAEEVSKICPNAKIAVSHGRMNENDLENIINDYINKIYDVLITTTIIEIGIDIRNANTLIVNDADKFGLSQLYQLRGRVGRSDKVAYAFFLYKNNLTIDSEKRLKAIKEFSALGSGIKVALKDLEIRGAGDVFGLNQSGHTDIIGYELYIKFLNKALKYLEGDKNNKDFIDSYDTTVDIDIDAYIPDKYIEDEETKLIMYKKIAGILDDSDSDNLCLEMKDRFGEIPIEVKNLILISKIKNKAHSLYITDVIIKIDSFKIVFYEKAKLETKKLFDLINDYNSEMRLLSGIPSTLTYNAKKKNNDILKIISLVYDVLNSIKII